MTYIIYQVLSAVTGIIITLSIILCNTLCNPIAPHITRTIKDAVLTYIGFAFFENVNMSNALMIGLLVSFVGAIVYLWDSWVKLQY